MRFNSNKVIALVILTTALLFSVRLNPLGPVLVNSLGMRLLRIPAGDFEAVTLQSSGKVLHQKVRISRDFYITETEVTNFQWSLLSHDIYSEIKNCRNCPATGITWPLLQHYLNELNQREGCDLNQQEIWDVYRLRSDKNASGCYRLPTREEWRMVCQAGTRDYRGGLKSEKDQVNSIWFQRNSFATAREVATLRSSPWGLYDTLGNAEEWVIDDFPSVSATHHISSHLKTDPLILADNLDDKYGRMVVGGHANKNLDRMRCDHLHFHRDENLIEQIRAQISLLDSSRFAGLRLVRNP